MLLMLAQGLFLSGVASRPRSVLGASSCSRQSWKQSCSVQILAEMKGTDQSRSQGQLHLFLCNWNKGSVRLAHIF